MSDTHPGLRIGSEERSRVAQRLVSHFQAGQLERSELEARLGWAAQARTEDQLHRLTMDLPDLPAPRLPTATAPAPAHPLRIAFDVLTLCVTTAALICLALWLAVAAAQGGGTLAMTAVATFGALVVGSGSVYLIQRFLTISRR